jgi:hypothetical protein
MREFGPFFGLLVLGLEVCWSLDLQSIRSILGESSPTRKLTN